jgi:hypothetical protein
MSRVTFYPKQGTSYEDGWPTQVLGDGFINLHLDTTYGPDNAIYRDNFKEEYEFFDCEEGEWTVEVRED